MKERLIKIIIFDNLLQQCHIQIEINSGQLKVEILLHTQWYLKILNNYTIQTNASSLSLNKLLANQEILRYSLLMPQINGFKMQCNNRLLASLGKEDSHKVE